VNCGDWDIVIDCDIVCNLFDFLKLKFFIIKFVRVKKIENKLKPKYFDQ